MTEKITLALAQSGSVRGDIVANITSHALMATLALEYHADFIIFPELSLTGYEADLAAKSCISTDDIRLSPLKKLAENRGITIVAGVPVNGNGEKPNIGALVITPQETWIHRKNHLHPGEEQYFSGYGGTNRMLKIKGIKISLAICADIDHESHAETAARNGADIYAAGVLMMGGYDTSAERMKRYAEKYSMLTLMANHGLPTAGIIPEGRSAAWDANGLITEAPENDEALVIVTGIPGNWSGTVINLYPGTTEGR